LNRIHRLGYHDRKIQISTTKGLETLPIEIQSKSSQEIINYIFDLLQSGKPVYRSKLMVVGFERIGKTSLLDCLLPLHEYLYYGSDKKTMSWFKLQGRYLHRFENDLEETLLDEIVLHNKQWKLTEIQEKENEKHTKYGFELVRDIKPRRKVRYYCESEEERRRWVEKLMRLIDNKSTHGIDIQNHKIKTHDMDFELGLSVWDFAGQHEYYNNHHYFLSTRSLLLVCWKISEGDKGLKSLEFWLKSLKFHLKKNDLDQNINKPLVSIFIVGTHLDHPSVPQDEKSVEMRKEKIGMILNKLGMKYPIEIFEVSSMNLENIENLQNRMWKTISNHAYMGQKVPSSYLEMEDEIQEMRKEFQKNQNNHQNLIPLIPVTQFYENLKKKKKLSSSFNLSLVQRGLNLLTMWGECAYYNEPKLSDTLIYEPKFLTKGVLGQLFRPEFKKFYEFGILENKNLKEIWKDYSEDLIEPLFRLLEKFDVCFEIGNYEKGANIEWRKTKAQPNEELINFETEKNKLFHGKSIIPRYLGKKREDEIKDYFPNECPAWMIEKSRILIFEAIPQELISRILIKVHLMSQEHLIWRNGIYFDHGSQLKCLLMCTTEKNEMKITIRGTNFNSIKSFLTRLLETIKESLEKYQGVSYQEGILSSQNENFILIEEIEKYEKILPIEKRTKEQIDLLNRSCIFQSENEKGIIFFSYRDFSFLFSFFF